MGEFRIIPRCYDDIARIEGEAAAQALWEKRGGTGKYVPGFVADTVEKAPFENCTSEYRHEKMGY